MTLKNISKILIVSIFLLAGSPAFAGTFGYQGGDLISSFDIDAKISGSKFYLSESAEITSISVYVEFAGGWSFDPAEIQTAIYNDTGNLIATTTKISNEADVVPADWYDFYFAENPVLEAGNYWLVAWGNNGRPTEANYIFLESGTSLETYTLIYQDFEGWDFPATFSGSFVYSENVGIYATYEATIPEEPEEATSTYLTIPAGFNTDLLAYAGTLFTDLNLIVQLAIGLPVGFWIIRKVIGLVKAR